MASFHYLALLLNSGVFLTLLLPTEAPAQTEYRVEIDPASVFSAVRPHKGQNARFVSLQFQLKRTGDQVSVTDVPRENIVVEEDGQPVANLQLFPPRSRKLTVVLALDISGSMARAGKIDEAKQAALAFLDRLDARADVGLILFDHLLRVVVAPARNPANLPAHKAGLKERIRKAQPQGGTAYLDATVQAVELLRGIEGQRVIVVLTDGVDMNSGQSLAQAIQAAALAELPVYTIGIGEPGRDESVYTVLVLDESGSMSGKADLRDSQTKMQALKRAASRFVELMRPNAKTTLLPFSTRPEVPGPFSDDRPALIRRINALQARGGTALYDATLDGLETLVANNLRGRRAVITLTDGIDESPGSRRATVNSLLARAREVGIPVFMLGLGNPREINEEVMQRIAKETGGEYYHAGNEQKLIELFEQLSIQLHDDGIDERSLRELAGQTGGKYAHVSKISELSVFYERLADELQNSYQVTFLSQRSSHDGTARGIEVKVLRQGRVVSTDGEAVDVARGVLVPRMSYTVYLVWLFLLVLLCGPAVLRRGSTSEKGV